MFGVGKDIAVVYWMSRLAYEGDQVTKEMVLQPDRCFTYLYTGIVLVITSAVYPDGGKIEASGVRTESLEEGL